MRITPKTSTETIFWVEKSLDQFDINISTDIKQYRGIIPCGISDYGITSIDRLISTNHSLYEISMLILQHLTDSILSLSKGATDVKV